MICEFRPRYFVYKSYKKFHRTHILFLIHLKELFKSNQHKASDIISFTKFNVFKNFSSEQSWGNHENRNEIKWTPTEHFHEPNILGDSHNEAELQMPFDGQRNGGKNI